MARSKIFLCVFIIFTLHVLSVGRNIRTGKIKMEMINKISAPVTEKSKVIKVLSNWHTANASFYDSKDSSQTRDDGNGIGAFGRQIKSGSIALGSHFTKYFQKKGIKVYIQVKNLNVMTPYGKGIFRVDDIMAKRFSKRNKYYIDFFHEDLDLKYKLLGRFKVKFKIYKVE